MICNNIHAGWPWRSFAMAALAVLIYTAGLPLTELLVYNRSAVLNGELWRIFTCHLVHCDIEHLCWNIGGLITIGILFESQSSNNIFTLFTFAAAVICGWLILDGKLANYCGLSGILNAFLAAGLLAEWKANRSWLYVLTAAGAITKIIIETFTNSAIFTTTTWPPVPESHLLGFITGIIHYPMNGGNMSAPILNYPLSKQSNTNTLIALATALLPAAATLISFYYEVLPHAVYACSKVLMIALPLWMWRRQGLQASDILNRAGIQNSRGIVGVASGLTMFGIVFGGYFFIFSGTLDPTSFQNKLTSLGLVDHYWAACIFTCLLNSALEEWFWRGFILDQFRNALSDFAAVVTSSILFGAHHYFVLLQYFPQNLALFFTFGTVAAGAAWAIMRLRGASLLDCWISHVLADIAVVSIGWILLQ